MLKIDLRPGVPLQIGEAIVRIVKKHGQTVSMVIDAPRHVKIKREDEIESQKVQETNISSP